MPPDEASICLPFARQKLVEVDDDPKLCTVYEQYMATELPLNLWLKNKQKGCICLLVAGMTKFPMKQQSYP
jgi:hypothetical protein